MVEMLHSVAGFGWFKESSHKADYDVTFGIKHKLKDLRVG